ncbi:ABC transporter permease [Paenibacillus sp. PL91]|uniref:ABC transporter permease n=1 Tax=Paenibacillus sp. PL91 TaxID=2729538 RepID=UPI00145DED44|nr:ABC transporter permease [Paenibacillus sp. PL91]MBC9199458.1 ABC transporter permease [Paenibacillus sp. PL91]
MTYLFEHLDKVTGLLIEHIYLVSLSLVISILVAAVISRFTKVQSLVMGVLGTIYTIPSIALFALLIPFLGLGVKPAAIALIAYSQMALVRNMVVAIKGIEPSIVEAARGMGMGKWRMIYKIIVPLALPVVVAGIRIAAVSMIGIATIAAFINAGGLGKLIFEGIYQDHSGKIIAGTVAVLVLVIATDLVFRFIERRVSLNTR